MIVLREIPGIERVPGDRQPQNSTIISCASAAQLCGSHINHTKPIVEAGRHDTPHIFQNTEHDGHRRPVIVRMKQDFAFAWRMVNDLEERGARACLSSETAQKTLQLRPR